MRLDFRILSILLVGSFASQADALIVMNLDPSANYVAPTSQTLPGFSDVDPGWANVSTFGVYLGNGWIVTANHAIADSAAFETLNGEQFPIVPGSMTRIKNPNLLTDRGYSQNADLKLFRIGSHEQFSGTPEERAAAQGLEIQPIQIGQSSLSANKQIVILAEGRVRGSSSPLLHWEAPISSTPNWGAPTVCTDCFLGTTPQQIAANGQLHAVGYTSSDTRQKAWGTNKVESSSSAASSLQDFSRVNGTSYYVIDNPNSSTDVNTAAQAFDFDEYSFVTDANGAPISGGGNEAQAAGGDSGSGVFSWNGSSWQLNGVLHSIACFVNCGYATAIRRDNGSASDTAYGDFSLFSDFSLYRTQLEAYLGPPAEYPWTGPGEDPRFFHLVDRSFGYDAAGNVQLVHPGHFGDVNLDGVISGDGTGSWETDDITAFVQGWGWQQEHGDIFSWKRGDLNQDGITDLQDFVLLRGGMNAMMGTSPEFSQLFAPLAPTQVPEPSTALLAALSLLGGWFYFANRT